MVVAPLVGAWIETSISVSHTNVNRVAPLVGAWIETYIIVEVFLYLVSRPSRGGVD